LKIDFEIYKYNGNPNITQIAPLYFFILTFAHSDKTRLIEDKKVNYNVILLYLHFFRLKRR
jgi:hypothetical protein